MKSKATYLTEKGVVFWYVNFETLLSHSRRELCENFSIFVEIIPHNVSEKQL